MRKSLVPVFIMVAFILFLGITGCGNSPSTTTEATSTEAEPETSEQEESSEEVVGTWYLGQQKDDFGDVVEDGDKYVYQYFAGEFSNTATSGSELTGMMRAQWDYDLQDYFIMFSLHEYNDAAATYTSRDTITLKTKDSNGTIRDYDLVGTPPNGYIGTKGAQFLTDLMKEPDAIRCVINIGSSRYEFSISSKGFNEALAEYEADYADKVDKIDSHSIEEAFSNIMPGNDAQSQLLAAQYLTNHVSEYEELDQTEQDKLVPGTYAVILFNTVNPDPRNWDGYYLRIYSYDNNVRSVIGYTDPTGVFISPDSPDSEEYRKEDGSILWPFVTSGRILRIVDGYYILQFHSNHYVFDDGVMDGGLMFACDEKGNPTTPLAN